MEIGTITIAEEPDGGIRYMIHLNKPDIKVLKQVKAHDSYKLLPPGKYVIREDFTYDRKQKD